MKSSISFRKIALQIWKKQIWVFAFSCLLFFLAGPVYFMTRLTAWDAPGYQPQDMSAAFASVFTGNGYYQNSNMLFFMAAVVAVACVSAWNGFSYLHSRSKTDFYHALPLRRQKLFALQILSAFADYVLPAAAALLIIAAVGTARHLMSIRAALGMISVFLAGLAYFLLNYLTAVLAMMLTGKVLVGMLGTAVFFGILPLLGILFQGYADQFFSTNMYPVLSRSDFLVRSPAFSAILLPGKISYETHFTGLFPILAADVVLTVICLLIYKVRPSQSAEKSMAFKIPGEVILVCLTVIGALAMGLFFRSADSYRDEWTLFGLIFGVLLLYAVIRMIYHLDIRKIFSGKIQLAAAFIITLCIAATFRFDLTGYDTYLPSQSQIKSIGFGQQAVDGGSFYSMMSGSDYAQIPAEDTTYELLKRLVTGNKIFQDTYNEDQPSDTPTCYQTVTVVLKNGRRYQRQYHTYTDDVKEQLASLYDTDVFKERLYSILQINPSRFEDMMLVFPDVYHEDEKNDNYWEQDTATINQSRARQELIEALQSDTAAMSSGTVLNDPVTGRLSLTIDMGGLELGENGELTEQETYIPNTSMYGMNVEMIIPLYPSFKKTLAVLDKYGYSTGPLSDEIRITSIDIFEENGNVSQTLTDTDEIADMLPRLSYGSFYTMWQSGKPVGKVFYEDPDGRASECYVIIM